MIFAGAAILLALSSAVANAERLQIKSFGPDVNLDLESSIEREPLRFYSTPSSNDPIEIAKEFALTRSQQTSTNEFGLVVKDAYKSKSTEITHVYLKQTFQGAEIMNADMGVHIDTHGRVLTYSSSFFTGDASPLLLSSAINSLKLSPSGQHLFMSDDGQDSVLSPAEAVVSFAKYLNLSSASSLSANQLSESLLTDIETSPLAIVSSSSSSSSSDSTYPVFAVGNVPFAAEGIVQMTPRFLIDSDQTLQPVWDMNVDMKSGDNWLSAQLHLSDGRVLQLNDWVKESLSYAGSPSEAYRVFPIGVNDPTDGDRELLVNPYDKDASPLGWHDQGKYQNDRKFGRHVTVGNNVYAQANPSGGSRYENQMRPKGQMVANVSDNTFDYAIDFSQDPTTYLKASIVNLFYWNNVMHDLFYHYGFNEKSGNFQEDNLGRGGRDKDAVIANAQDGSGLNNANFATPPDGQKGRMRMYIWTQTKPRRDGDLESGIVIHEYGHGISNRLTGGPMNSNCLGYGESGGMGEGWSDLFATMLRMCTGYNSSMHFTMGEYSANRGIRPYPYSTSKSVNPFTYNWIQKPGYGEVHAIGAVWAEILFEVYWAIVDVHGFNPNWYAVKEMPDMSKWEGNLKVMQLVVDGMKLQPCRPSFIDARDAILNADKAAFGGDHFCLLWTAFAKRGLGVNAKKGGFECFTLPTECQ